jgi:type III secretion protein F
MQKSWDGGPQGPGNGDSWKGWLGSHSAVFDNGVTELKAKLDDAFKDLAGDGTSGGDPTNPQLLANYQTALSEYTTFRSLQSNSAKSLADMQKQNARNLG